MCRGKQHSSLCMAYCALLARFHTGVEYCLFAQGLTRASLQINELLHTFVLYTALWSMGARSNSFISMRFNHFFRKIVLREVYVKNASPSPSYSGSLINDWESYKNTQATHCARCRKKIIGGDKVGGHVLKVPGLALDYYVVPLCKGCNNPSVNEPYYVKNNTLVRLIDIKRHNAVRSPKKSSGTH